MAGISFTISADASKANREMSSFEKKTRKIVSSISKGFKERIGHKLFDGLIGAARAVPGMLNEAVNAATSLNEEIGKSQAVFGDSSKQILDWSKDTAEALGMSRLESLKATGQIGNLLKAFGIGEKEAANMSQSLVELAADMGSFNEASNEEVITAISAAMRGEKEAITRLGATFDDAALKVKAFEMGIADGKSTLTASQKALASYNLIMEQTAHQQGNFALTSNDLANSKKRLNAKLEDVSAEIGKALLPAMEALVNFLNEADIDSFSEGITGLVTTFVDLAGSIKEAYLNALDFFGILPNIKKETPDMSRFAGEFERPPKTEQDQRFDRGTKAILEAEAEAVAKRIASLKNNGKKKKESDLDRMIRKQEELSLETERAFQEDFEERKKQLEEKIKSIRKGVSMDEAMALAEFGMSSAKSKNRINELIGQGISEKDAKEIAGRESDVDKLMKTRDILSSMAGRSSITAVSSMQRIGGGGGVSTQLDYQKRQAQLQEQMVSLLSEIKERQKPQSISDY